MIIIFLLKFILRNAILRNVSWCNVFVGKLVFPAMAIAMLASALLAVVSAQAADKEGVPPDEVGLTQRIDLQAVSSDTSDIEGVWGKCLKSVDTRCYFMDIDSAGSATILTYVSTRGTQFGEDPSDESYCYNRLDRALARLGEYTYIWEDKLASGSDLAPGDFLKIVVRDNALLVFKGDKLQLVLPEMPVNDRADMTIC